MPFDPHPGHAALRKGRWSESGAGYFLTFCTLDRRPGLTAPDIVKAVWAETDRLDTESVWDFRTGVVMPDHVPLLVEINPTPGLTGAVRLFKGRLSRVLRDAGLKWQPAYFDHRLRPGEDWLPLFLYIYLNPYRAKLRSTNQSWPGYRCSKVDLDCFDPLTNCACPYPEWLS
jgi:REP element-mobilizing transposase RayT